MRRSALRAGRAPLIPALLSALFATGCASAGSTVGSGVGERLLEHAPYYAGPRSRLGEASAERRIGILPVYFQPGDAEASIFAPPWAAESQLEALLGDMNEYLDSATAAGDARFVKLVEGRPVSAVAPTTMGAPPDVRFGCLTEADLPDGDCAAPEGALGREPQYMKLAVARPSPTWIQWTAQAMDGWGVDHVVVLTVELGEYLPRQRGLAGHKYVELGSSYAVDLPWLTSLETPVLVLQMTGALMDHEGRAVRIGAEGLLPKRTRLIVSSLGGQELWGDEDLARLRTQRREDLDGRPLVWQEAMRQLLEGLTR